MGSREWGLGTREPLADSRKWGMEAGDSGMGNGDSGMGTRDSGIGGREWGHGTGESGAVSGQSMWEPAVRLPLTAFRICLLFFSNDLNNQLANRESEIGKLTADSW